MGYIVPPFFDDPKFDQIMSSRKRRRRQSLGALAAGVCLLLIVLAISLAGCASSGSAPTAGSVGDFSTHPGFCSQSDWTAYKNVQSIRAGLVQASADFAAEPRAAGLIAAAKASYNVLSDAYDGFHRALHAGGDISAPCVTDAAALQSVLDPAKMSQAQADLAVLLASFSKKKGA